MKKVLCEFYNYHKKTFDQVEIDFNLKVYPCCAYYREYKTERLDKKDPFLKLNTSLKAKSFKKIISSFEKIFNEKTWSNPNKCSSLCKRCIIVEQNRKKCDYKIK
jgi:hypothetical protein